MLYLSIAMNLVLMIGCFYFYCQSLKWKWRAIKAIKDAKEWLELVAKWAKSDIGE